MSSPQPFVPPLQPSQIVFLSSRRWGKTWANAMAPVNAALRGMKASLVVFDEWTHGGPLRADEFAREYRAAFQDMRGRVTLPTPDRSHFHRGGRYRKPPAASKPMRPPMKGMIPVRDRTGKMTWRDKPEQRMEAQPTWGMF